MNSKKSISSKNGGTRSAEFGMAQQDEEDLINADEFEEIAEIYDSIRVLHSNIDPERDQHLAQDFDFKLRQVMEDLSEAVKSPEISKTIKIERSLTSKFELYLMCSEKLCDFVKD